MIPRFSHLRPTGLEAALDAYTSTQDEGTYYAGGTELLQVMKAGFAAYSTLIDLKHIDELRGISVSEDGSLRIGAAATHREIERAPLVREHVPGLARLTRHVANVRVRNAGTLGGNLAFAEPHSDPAAFLLACGAQVELAGPDGRRTIGIDELVIGPLVTSREPSEIIVAVHVPPAGQGVGRSYEKIAFFERPAAAVGVRLTVRDGTLEEVLVTVGSITDVPMAVPAAASALEGVEATEAALNEAAPAAASAFADLEVTGDHNGSADFKRHLAGKLLAQAASGALAEAAA